VTAPIRIAGIAHVGIRVHELERSLRFYSLLGFTKTAGPMGPEPVAILHNDAESRSIWSSTRPLRARRTC